MTERQWFEVKGRTFFAIAMPIGRQHFGLTRDMPVRFGERRLHPVVPFGWRGWRIEGRNAYRIAPLWLYWPIRLWHKRWAALEPLIWCGLWYMADEGGYYNDGHFTFRTWTSFARLRTVAHIPPRLSVQTPINMAERIAWWLEARAADFNERMPRWW